MQAEGSQQSDGVHGTFGAHARFRAAERQPLIDMVFAALAAVVVPADIRRRQIQRSRGFAMAGVGAFAERQRTPAQETHAQNRQQQKQRHQFQRKRKIHDGLSMKPKAELVKTNKKECRYACA